MAEAQGKPYSATFTIPGLPPTLNVLNRMYWQKRSRINRQWKDLVAIAIRNHNPPEPLKRARICFTRHSSKPTDLDNCAGSAKAMLDSLKGTVIVDDSMDIVDTEYKWKRAPAKRGHVEISIQEIT